MCTDILLEQDGSSGMNCIFGRHGLRHTSHPNNWWEEYTKFRFWDMFHKER